VAIHGRAMLFDAHANAARYIRRFVVPALAAAIAGFASSAALAQCTAQDFLKHQLDPGRRMAGAAQPVIRAGRDIDTWKTIAVGTFAGPLELRNHLDDLGCHVGDKAGEILARPAFALASHKAEAELVLVTPAQLGFSSETVTLADLYARARQAGLVLARPEIGPQLRIQYFDQPIGEFLTIGMEPIKTWNGEPIILNVANGGAGLILIGQDGRPEAEVPVTSRFVFERSTGSAPSAGPIDQVAAFRQHKR
jgi:hypothetical protein